MVLLEATHPGDGATGRNAGFLLAESECHGLAAERHGRTVADGLREAGLATRAAVRALVSGRERWHGLRFPGSVRFATDVGEAAAFERSAAALDDDVRLGSPVAREAGCEMFDSALYDDGDGVVHPLRLLATALGVAESHGVRRFDGSPVHEVRARRGGVRVITREGHVDAARVVMTTNAALRLVLPAARAIRPVRAQVLVADVEPTTTWRRPAYAARGGDYWRPLSRGRVLLGGLRRLARRNENTRSDAPTEALQHELDRLLSRLVGRRTRRVVTHRWAGTMAFTRDGLPWVGRLAGRRRVFALAGLNGHGMGWAPGLAESLAAHVVGDGPPPPRFLRPDRSHRTR